MDELIRTENLTKVYGEGATAVHALAGVSLTVMPGEYVAVMGPSGCGKSTLLNMLGALDQPTSGTVWVNGENLAELSDVDAFRAKTVGFIFQLHNLLPTLTALENIEVPMTGQGLSKKEQRERATYLLDLVGLGERLNAMPNQLSGGQRQRVAVARALANDPALILADEPTGSLDSQSGEEIMNLLSDLNQSQGTTILVVTHDRRVAQSTERIIRMKDGQILSDHRLLDPLEEDLRTLARSRLGQAVMGNNGLHTPYLSSEEQAVLRELLAKIDDA